MKKNILVVILVLLASFAFAAGEKEGGNVVKVAASITPHAEILTECIPLMQEKGYELEIVEFTDYVLPNNVVESGEIDCNYFQHLPYMDVFNIEQGTHLVSIAAIHYEPFGIYPGIENDLKNISKGAKIAVPNDTTNEARALLLLQDNGIIKLREGAGLTATKLDIVANPFDVDIIEMEAAQIARIIDEMSFIVLNGNYALQAGLNVLTDAIAYETAESQGASTYANILCVKEGNEKNEGVLALKAILESEEIGQFMKDNYSGAVVPAK